MAEDQGKQDEEKFDFTREGEALGYISLDQAEVLAMRTARETPGAYGSSYVDVPMAFDVIETEDTEDHYRITISFRPEGEYAGRPGREQFFIEKEGAIALRQVLSLPGPTGWRRYRFGLVAIGLVVVVVAAVGGVLAVSGGGGGNDDVVPQAAAPPTLTPESTPVPPTSAPSPSPTLTPVATPLPANTLQPNAPPKLTNTPLPTPRPTNTPVMTATPKALPTISPHIPIYGPISGQLIHAPDAGEFEFIRGPGISEPVMIEITFFNPYPVNEAPWTYGLMFQEGEGEITYFIDIVSDGSWRIRSQLPGTEWSELTQEQSPHIDKNDSGKNHLRLIIVGTEAWLFINKQFEFQVDVSALTFPGRINAFVMNERSGKATPFKDFTVWRWSPELAPIPAVAASLEPIPTPAPTATPGPTPTPDPSSPIYGPIIGALVHDESSSFETFSGPSTSSDIVIEATFLNPYPTTKGTWSHGFVLGNTRFNFFHSIEIRGNGTWRHRLRLGPNASVTDLISRNSKNIRIAEDGMNQLRLILVGDEAWFFINGVYEDKLDLSRLTDQAPIKLFIGRDEIPGYVTRFEGFKIWNWSPELAPIPVE